MLDSDVDALLEVAVADWLVEDDTDGGLGYVVDYARLAVVEFVGHTLLHCSVTYYVDDVSDSGGLLDDGCVGWWVGHELVLV